MSKLILFDIDGTLIDTWHLKQHMAEVMSKELGISKEMYERAHKSFVETLEHKHDFHPSPFFQYMQKHFGSTTEHMLRSFYDPEIFQTFLFPDTIEALKRLAQSHQLGIFSEGFTSFQMKKLELTGLTRYFDPALIFIFRRKLLAESLALVSKNALIIDDDLNVIKSLEDQGYLAKLIDREGKSPRVKSRISLLTELK